MSQANAITPHYICGRTAHHVLISVKHCDTKLTQIRHKILDLSLRRGFLWKSLFLSDWTEIVKVYNLDLAVMF
jgi:hypothetical protein